MTSVEALKECRFGTGHRGFKGRARHVQYDGGNFVIRVIEEDACGNGECDGGPAGLGHCDEADGDGQLLRIHFYLQDRIRRLSKGPSTQADENGVDVDTCRGTRLVSRVQRSHSNYAESPSAQVLIPSDRTHELSIRHTTQNEKVQ